jgi:hypothetical protein
MMSDKKREPGVPYVEIMPDGSMMQFIDLGNPRFCLLGVSDETLEEIKRIEELEKLEK